MISNPYTNRTQQCIFCTKQSSDLDVICQHSFRDLVFALGVTFVHASHTQYLSVGSLSAAWDLLVLP